MKVMVAENAGFCFGVKRAIALTHEVIKRKQAVYSLGPLIHNPQVVETIDGIEKGTVVIRSHGVPPQILKKAEQKGLEIVDATCPFVKESQNFVKMLDDEGYKVIIVGDRNHPEVRGLLGYAKEAEVVSGTGEAKRISGKRIGLVSQTTQPTSKLTDVVSIVLEKVEELRVFNTVCSATIGRQEGARKLAKDVDVMVIVGGYNSGNTCRLYEICTSICPHSHHIERAEEIKPEWFNGCKIVGITAGASTPNYVIKEIYKALENM
jgi:4-hydroxy-3-methylbut-2-enyl diphosphate reductase